jgi:hypothetical protein
MSFEREPWAGTFRRIMLGNEKVVNEEAGGVSNITFADGVFYEISGFVQV